MEGPNPEYGEATYNTITKNAATTIIAGIIVLRFFCLDGEFFFRNRKY